MLAIKKKKKKLGKDVEELEPSYNPGVMIKQYSHCGKTVSSSQRAKQNCHYNLGILLLAMCPRVITVYIHIKLVHRCSQQYQSEEPRHVSHPNTHYLMNG